MKNFKESILPFQDLFLGITQTSIVQQIVDGDTFWSIISINSRLFKIKVRMLHIDTPELHPLLNDPDREQIQREAQNAKRHLETLLTCGTSVTLECGSLDAFGRLLAVVYVNNGSKSINQTMLDDGYAVPNEGEKKMKWSEMWTLLQQKRLLQCAKP